MNTIIMIMIPLLVRSSLNCDLSSKWCSLQNWTDDDYDDGMIISLPNVCHLLSYCKQHTQFLLNMKPLHSGRWSSWLPELFISCCNSKKRVQFQYDWNRTEYIPGFLETECNSWHNHVWKSAYNWVSLLWKKSGCLMISFVVSELWQLLG